MPRQWTDKRRAALAEGFRNQQPLKHSTGPKTVAANRGGVAESAQAASLEMAYAIRNEAYRRYGDGDYGGHRQLAHLAALVCRRVWRRFKGRSKIKPRYLFNNR